MTVGGSTWSNTAHDGVAMGAGTAGTEVGGPAVSVARGHERPLSARSRFAQARRQLSGVAFAACVLTITGIFQIISGLVAIRSNSRSVAPDAR